MRNTFLHSCQKKYESAEMLYHPVPGSQVSTVNLTVQQLITDK